MKAIDHPAFRPELTTEAKIKAQAETFKKVLDAKKGNTA